MVLSDLIDDFDLVDAGTVRNETSEVPFTDFEASCHARLDRVSVSVAAMLRKYPRHVCLFFGSLFYIDGYLRKRIAEAI